VGKQGVVVAPELTLLGGSHRRLGGELGIRVIGQRAVAELHSQLRWIAPPQLGELLVDAGAVR
jgi:hypothetical protein